MNTTPTEVIVLHVVTYAPPRGALRIVRAYCRCGWAAKGPAHRARRRGLAHEQGRRP